MSDERIWTAAELEQLAPEEHQRLFDERVVTDLSTLDPDFLARVRARGRELLHELGIPVPDTGRRLSQEPMTGQ